MKVFIFRGKEISYDYEWTHEHCFTFDFGDGEFVDDEGDSYFIHCQYEDDTDSEFFFELWYEDDLTEADIITDDEREYIKHFMIELMANIENINKIA